MSKFDITLEYKDIDYLTSMDSSYAINWFDVRLGIQNKAQAEPAAYEADLCVD